MITFSIIIPVYQHSGFLQEALDSAVNQRMKPQEIIVVDDGSDQTQAEAIRSICESFPSVKLMRYPRNHGVSHARNLGVKIVTGDFVIFLDADDLLEESFLLECSESLATGSVDVLMAKAELISNDLDHRQFKKRQATYAHLTERYHHSDVQQPGYFSVYCPAIHGLVFRREIFHQFQFNEQLRYGEDRYLMLELRNAGLQFKCMKSKAGSYRMNGGLSQSAESKLAYTDAVLQSDLLVGRHDRAFIHLLKFTYLMEKGALAGSINSLIQGFFSYSALRAFISILLRRLF